MDNFFKKIKQQLFKKSYKKEFFLALFSSLTLISCKFKDSKSIDDTKESINKVSVIIDDQLWNGAIGDSIRNKFAAPVIGLPQEEPLFTINQYPSKLLDGIISSDRNIIIIKKEPKKRFEIIKDEYFKPQNVIHISGQTVNEITAIIQDNTPLIIQKIRQTEIAEVENTTKKALLDPQKIASKFNISLEVPKSYRYVMRRNKFIWLKKEMTSGSTSILIYQIPIHNIKNTKNTTSNIVRMRDSIGSLYIHGVEKNTRMITENSYAPYLSKIIFNNREAFETRGTWEMKNDFMSGPFINYCIVDKPYNRMIVLEGFCYAPSKEKRDIMFELESTIKSIVFYKKEK